MAGDKEKRATQEDLKPTDKEAAEVKGGAGIIPERKRRFLRRKGAPAGGGSANAKPM